MIQTYVLFRADSADRLHFCCFGTDVPSKDQRIAHNRFLEDIRGDYQK